MAERNSTSKARSGRKLSVSLERRPRIRRTRDASAARRAVPASANLMDSERERLMRAESILGCIAFALMYSDWREEEGTDYATAVEVARELVRQSIGALEQLTSPSSREAQSQP